MAVITKDELMSTLKTLTSENTSDEVLSFVENVSDTMDDLINKTKGDGKDWKAEYEKNDAEWRQRYKDRFFSSDADGDSKTPPIPTPITPEPEETSVPHYTYGELFKASTGKE